MHNPSSIFDERNANTIIFGRVLVCASLVRLLTILLVARLCYKVTPYLIETMESSGQATLYSATPQRAPT